MDSFSAIRLLIIVTCINWSVEEVQVVDRRVERLRDLTDRVRRLNLQFREYTLEHLVQIRTGKCPVGRLDLSPGFDCKESGSFCFCTANKTVNWFEADATCRRYGMALIDDDQDQKRAFSQLLTGETPRYYWDSTVVATVRVLVSGTTGRQTSKSAAKSAVSGRDCYLLEVNNPTFEFQGACMDDSVGLACRLVNPKEFEFP